MKLLAIAGKTIKVDVRYYSTNDRIALSEFPTFEKIEALVSETLEIPQAEFLTYYLFHRIRIGAPGYRDYDSLGRQVHHFLGAIAESIDYDGGTVRTPVGFRIQLPEVSEHIGEAIGLAVMNRIHDLTQADWMPLPHQGGRQAAPSFDYQIASDGKHFVQVETKGSSVVDNRELTTAVRQHKHRIAEKKAKLLAHAAIGQDPYPAAFRYGTITVVDGRADGNVRCLLTDPPADAIDDDPRRFRLLSRLRYLLNMISIISPRSNFTAVLATRVFDLEALDDPFELDSVSLRRPTGEEFDFAPERFSHWDRSSFMSGKSVVTDGPAGGILLPLSADNLFFFGIRERLVTLASEQRFGAILDYRAPVATTRKTVDCVVSESRFERLGLPNALRPLRGRRAGYVHFRLTGNLNYSPEGLVFGVLPLPDR
jgi:hypothetical protein